MNAARKKAKTAVTASRKKSGKAKKRSKAPKVTKASAEKPEKGTSKRTYSSPIAERKDILKVINKAGQPLTYDQLLVHFEYHESDEKREALRRRLGAMCRDGQLIRNRKQGFVPVDANDLVAGHISAHADGFGFLVVDDESADIYLNATQMRQVLHGDKAVVCITGTDHRGRKEGRITDVLERANTRVVGRLVIDQGVTYIQPDNKRIHLNLLIPPRDAGDASNGDMVVAEIVEQPSRRNPPVGRIVEVLGEHLTPGMEIDVAIHSHGIPSEWPADVIKQTSKYKDTVSAKDIKNRRDVRDLPLVTIDGADARDFDDAVYCEKTETGWRLFVAIADVSHYVKPGSALDNEAQNRGTSVYFPGRVVPMLPEELSNGLCSLNPDVDRLCMLCIMSLDSTGELKRTRFQRAVMRSYARLTYEQANEIVMLRDKEQRKKFRPLVPHLDNLYKLFKVLSRQRQKRGAIEFESNESRIEFDADRKINAIVPVMRNDAHKLIEECMILANVATAGYLLKRKMPALYRVHHGPQADRLDDLRSFLALRGLKLTGGDKPGARDFAALAKSAAKLPDATVIHTVMLRSMQAAVYQPGNEGHFGLSLDHYAHFTSPIRRYPDLLVHRAIGHILDGGKPSNYGYSANEMTHLGEHCSTTERRAEEATRDVTSWLKCEYMLEHIGDTFNGVISTVTSFGLFIQLKGIYVDGLAHIASLGSDYYHFDQAAHTLTGERSGVQYALGDSIRVKVTAVNLDERKIDFQTIDGGSKSQRRGGGKDSRKGRKGRKGSKARNADDAKKTGKQKHKPKNKNKKKHKSKKKKGKSTTQDHASIKSNKTSRGKSSNANPGAGKTATKKSTGNDANRKRKAKGKTATRKRKSGSGRDDKT